MTTRNIEAASAKVCTVLNNVLDSMSHNERAIVGSVRVAPRKASPIRFSITVADLAGYWIGGIVTSTDYYNNSGQYQNNSLTAVNYGYTIASRGAYTYNLRSVYSRIGLFRLTVRERLLGNCLSRKFC